MKSRYEFPDRQALTLYKPKPPSAVTARYLSHSWKASGIGALPGHCWTQHLGSQERISSLRFRSLEKCGAFVLIMWDRVLQGCVSIYVDT